MRVFQLLDRYQSPTGFGGRPSRGKSDAQPLLGGAPSPARKTSFGSRGSKRGSSAGNSKRPSTMRRGSNFKKGSGTGLVERAQPIASRDTNVRRTGGNIFDLFKGGHMDALDRARGAAFWVARRVRKRACL